MKQDTQSMTSDEPNDGVLLPIGEVSALTGVNAVTLRAWQRRFGLVIPARTPKGHRLYTSENIQEIHEINAWLAKGVAISKVKPLLMSAAKLSSEMIESQVVDLWGEQIIALNAALFDFNQHKLQQILDDAFGLYPFQLVKEKLLQPWLNQLDDLADERLDAELILAWLKSELLSRVGGRYAFTGQAIAARMAVVQLSRGAATPPSSTRTKSLFSLLLLLELASLRVSVIDLGEQAIGSLPLLQGRLNVDALLLIPDPNHSGSEQTEMLTVLAQMSFPCRFVGPFVPTLTSLSAFWAPSMTDFIGQMPSRSVGKVNRSHKGKGKSEQGNSGENNDIS
ncbi:MerR family transcriptional regulator [Shewanella sp. SP2S2-4]|uniref:MerR family transcriptional regulator n=1 Tax=Shewanella TaxID=22 RepID=UPI00217E2B26|nr:MULTISPECIES: MerR family transcriptional regulator [Shewanella]MCS6098467.1 MerR family transcriptional regulator [Shewanella baltica]MCS6122162.1 MerR family transcriptional regulator [Shewanella baltica]MCS6181653.1 MerR family transcriptional regulator [Shewanella baltica]MDT3272549.1 MerR family transcriptional regulator [Shewanella sp. SP2S2-4]